MERKLWIGLAVIVGVSAWRFGADTYTIEGYTDHLRHEYSAWAFLQEGFRIFTTPAEAWTVSGGHSHVLWGFAPHFYPVGSVLLFLPFGVAANVVPVHWAMSTLLALASIWAFTVFWKTVGPLRLLLTVIVGVLFLHWGFNGFYDPLVAGVCIYGLHQYSQKAYGPAALWLAVGLSLHYRVWYLAPFAIAAFWGWWREARDWKMSIPAVLGVASLATFALSVGHTSGLAEGGIPSLAVRLDDWAPYALAGAVVVVGLVGWWERSWLTTLTVALAVVSAVVYPQWQDWYLILLTPLFALPKREPSQVVLAVAWLHVAILGFPNLLRLADLYMRGVT